MTLMAIFGKTDATITVTCQANYDIADTDILFVLDTTGSMACLPSDSTSTCNTYAGSASKITYSRPSDSTGENDSMAGYPGSTGYYVQEKSGSRIAALRTAVLNFYDTMKANVDSSTHVRYGFVTYTSTVNAGKAIVSISPAYMIGGSGNSTRSWTYQSRVRDGSTSWGVPRWVYKSVALDVSGYVAGSSVTDPSKANGATSAWLGCVEERNTTAGASSFSTSNLPADLDPDLVPSSAGTSWRPMWPEVEYARNNYGSTAQVTSSGDDEDNHPNLGHPDQLKAGYVSCGKPVRRLGEMTRTEISDYVNAADFRPIGGTYHDTGMIWGTRLLSPDGIFANDTQAWPGRQEPNRVIVFLTDGDMSPNQQVYGMYGMEYYDRRVSNGSFNSLTAFHNARFLAECSKAKAMNIDVWTVAIDSSASPELQSCATTTSQALYTTTGGGLAATFSTIAKQIAMLRITE
jgi:hypothetical protein